MSLLLVEFLGASWLVAGCDPKASSESAPAASASALPTVASAAPKASATGTPAPPPAPNGANSAAADPMATVFGGMADELKNRPSVHPNVDDGFAAFAKAGVVVDAPTQSFGRTYKAAFCKHGLASDKTMSVLLCEYPDEAQAALGLAESKKAFPALTTRDTYARKTLMLATIKQGEQHPDVTLAAQKKVVATFNAL